jgi:hypothetical protein
MTIWLVVVVAALGAAEDAPTPARQVAVRATAAGADVRTRAVDAVDRAKARAWSLAADAVDAEDVVGALTVVIVALDAIVGVKDVMVLVPQVVRTIVRADVLEIVRADVLAAMVAGALAPQVAPLAQVPARVLVTMGVHRPRPRLRTPRWGLPL